MLSLPLQQLKQKGRSKGTQFKAHSKKSQNSCRLCTLVTQLALGLRSYLLDPKSKHMMGSDPKS